MAAALRLAQLQKAAGKTLSIAVLEKAAEPGAHLLSGAVLDPRALAELVPDFESKGAPLASKVHEDRIYFLTPSGKIKFPFTPPPLRNHGNYIISLQQLGKWLSGLVEAEGIDMFSGFAGSELLMDGERVVGVRTGDRGIGRHGEQRATLRAWRRHSREGDDPGRRRPRQSDEAADSALAHRGGPPTAVVCARHQGAVGCAGWPIAWRHRRCTRLGYPLDQQEFGGGFIYAMSDTRLSVGFVVGLDYEDPMFDPHVAFQQFKLHPLVSGLLRGGQMVRYGAKALPEGGWLTLPECAVAGALIVGDAAGFLNSMRLKGIHLAMKTGMLAAETAFDAVREGDTSEARLSDISTRRFARAGSARSCGPCGTCIRRSSTDCSAAWRSPGCRC